MDYDAQAFYKLIDEQERRVAMTNTAVFSKRYRKGINPFACQFQMAERADDDSIKFQAEFWPRDHGKTEIFTIGLVLRRTCMDPNHRTLIVRKNKDEGEKALSVISSELAHNKQLHEEYASYWQSSVGYSYIAQPFGRRSRGRSGVWSSDKIYCRRTRSGIDPTVEVVGPGGAITGGHFDLIILDDVEDDENTKTLGRCKGLTTWFRGTVLQLREPHTKIIVVGTLKTVFPDIYNYVMESKMWVTNVLPAILSHRVDEVEYREVVNEEGNIIDVDVLTKDVEVLCPEKWGIKNLMVDMLASGEGGEGQSIWIREKQNDLSQVQGLTFERSWFHPPYDGSMEGIVRIVRVWDIAVKGRGTNDFFAGAKLGLRDDGDIFIMNMIRGRWSWLGGKEVILNQMALEPDVEVGILSTGAGGTAYQELLGDQRSRHVYLMEIFEKDDKLARAWKWSIRAEAGIIHMVEGGWNETFLMEVSNFPGGTYDDQVDAVSGGYQMLTSPVPGLHGLG